MTRRLIAVLAVPFLALSLAACGDQTADLEKNASEGLQRGYPGAKVDCPSDVNTDKGKTFTCTVTGASIKEVTFKVVDDDGNVQPVSSK